MHLPVAKIEKLVESN